MYSIFKLVLFLLVFLLDPVSRTEQIDCLYTCVAVTLKHIPICSGTKLCCRTLIDADQLHEATQHSPGLIRVCTVKWQSLLTVCHVASKKSKRIAAELGRVKLGWLGGWGAGCSLLSDPVLTPYYWCGIIGKDVMMAQSLPVEVFSCRNAWRSTNNCTW